MNLTKASIITMSLATLPLLMFLASSVAKASHLDPALIQKLAQTVHAHVEQPYGVNSRNGNKVLGYLRSRAEDIVKIDDDRVHITLDGQAYTLVARESENSDGGDLLDLFVQTGESEDDRTPVATDLLAFGDPALAVLLVGGMDPEELPQVSDAALTK